MAVLEKVKLLCVIAALLSLGPVSAVKTGSKQQGDSIDLMRREHSQMTVDNNSSDLIEAVTSEKAQVALSATGSMSGVFHHEAHHAVTQATGFALNLNSSLQALGPQPVSYDLWSTTKMCEEGKWQPNTYAHAAGGGGSSRGTRMTQQQAIATGIAYCAGALAGDSSCSKEWFTVAKNNGHCWCVTDSECSATKKSGGRFTFKKQAPQTTTTTTTPAHKATFGTVHCMQKLSCYNKLKHKGVMFTCYCIFNMAVADADQIDCAEWLACMKQDDSNAFVASAVEVFYHLRNPYTIGDSSQLLQHSNEERSTVPKDDADCWHPDIHNEADLKCDCWDDMKASCSGNEGDALYECLRILLCGSPNVCHDWKQPVDPTLTGQCISSEISGATPSLAVQGIQKGEQRVLADMFQGRRQPPQNASLFASSVELEHSVSGKACARSAR